MGREFGLGFVGHHGDFAVLFFQYRSWLSQHHDDCAGGYEEAADQRGDGEFFTEHEPGENHDEGDAELVEWSDARGRTKLECAEVAQPRETGGETREREEEQCAAVEGTQFVLLAESESDAPGEDDDDGGADRRGQV